ncbi:MAG: hypothetical protein HY828_21255 [Actinobacteria bacterium]|nr:hypothetical protein [Actinomycetota bacterium]
MSTTVALAVTSKGTTMDHTTTTDHHHAAHPDPRVAPDSGHGHGHDSGHHGEPQVEHRGHGGHAGHGDHIGMFRRRFWWSLLLTVPVVLTSHMIMDWFGYSLDFRGIEWVGPILGTVIYAWAGWPFLESEPDAQVLPAAPVGLWATGLGQTCPGAAIRKSNPNTSDSR